MSQADAQDFASARKILIVAPAWVGDMVMAHSLVQTLHARAPGSRIDMLAPPATAPLAARMPGVDRTHLFPIAHGELGLGRRRAQGRALRAIGYDQAIVLPNSFKSALVPWWARIPRRTGWHGESRYGVLNDRRPLQAQRYPLMIQRFVALGLPPDAAEPTDCPQPRLRVDPDNRERLRAALGLGAGRPVLALCPGAEFGPAKRWPASHYAAVARHALDAGQAVWLIGSPAEADLCAGIAALAGGGAVNLAGRTRLQDAVDLLSAAARVICNDSGLMHVACALDLPVIALFGSTSADFTPPLGRHARVLRLGLDCSPCFQRECPLGHLRCLQDLAPERVVALL
ncbi:MAG: lipopolysaccharide heptosyltransferase II [Pseudomonadales bacterium]